jgi:lipopolysaccharide export system permease protein
MTWLSRLFSALPAALRWWRTAPYVGLGIALGCTLLLALGQLTGHSWAEMPWSPFADEDMAEDLGTPWLVQIYYGLLPLVSGLLNMSVVALLLYAFRTLPSARRMVSPLILVGGVMGFSLISSETHHQWFSDIFNFMGEPVSRATMIGKLIMIAIICLLPAVAFAWYARRSQLERYVLRTFLQPLCFCFIAFFSLFILMDLISNMRDYQDSGTPFGTVMRFYVLLLPAVFVMVAPWACLLATLFSLVKMSRFNEIISMLSAGRSLWQISHPLITVGVFVSLASMALNYHWAPHAESQRRALVEVKDKKTLMRSGKPSIAHAVTYYNEDTRRLWFIGRVPFDTRNERLTRIEVRQFDSKGRVEHAWLATSGKRWPYGTWALTNGVEVSYKDGVEIGTAPFAAREDFERGGNRIHLEFPETPWGIISATVAPDDLGVTELNAFILANPELSKQRLAPFRTHLFDRFARPWLALMMVFAAVPFGIAYSRRAALGGMAGAMILVVGLLFLPEMFASMAKGGHSSPKSAVWMPHLLFLIFGGGMFYLKSLNKEVPRFSLSNLLRWAGSFRKRAA